jgi:hypothetical protein
MHRDALRGLVCLALISLPVLAAGETSTLTADASATSGADPPMSTEERLKRLEAEIEELKKQLASAQPGAVTTPPPPATAASKAAPAGPAAESESTPETENAPAPLAPGTGLVLAKSQYGTVKLGMYALFRALDQEPGNQTLTDHLGNQTPINTRRDFQLHRILIPFSGWLYDPKFSYSVTIWTVNATEQVRVIGAFQYSFAPQFSLGGGMGSMPGTRSMNYSHPFWFGHDRVMADEFFRSGFTSGVWATGDIVPGLFYRVMVGNNISTLGISAAKNTRALAYGGTMAWMPTTGEYGPAGAYDDFEMHEQLATRFGFSIVSSPREDRASQPSASQPDATQIRLADSLLLFQTGSLAPGVTIQKANYQTRAIDASAKYHGFSIVAEAYYRKLQDFLPAVGSAPLPAGLSSITDKGFMVQTGFFPILKTLELYLSTSQIKPQTDLGFRRSYEVLGGVNWFWRHTRLQRVNFQAINVTRSAPSSVFGYYVGGLTGWIFAGDVSWMF